MDITIGLLFVIPLCLATVSDIEDSASSVLQFLESQSKKLLLTTETKDFVFVLGNTGSGKSTMVCLLSDSDLESVETSEDSGEFVLIDRSDRISHVSTITSKTSVPELMVNAKSGTVFVDCPGFQDSRGVANDIAVTYLIRKVLNFVERVKFVVAIDHNSVKMGGDRKDFKVIARHATTLIKDVDKYRDAIALVVTKVENRYERKDGNWRLVDDEKMIKGIVKFLQQAKADLVKSNRKDIPSAEKLQNDKTILFISILLDDRYHKIGIFRRAAKSGMVKDIPILREEKEYISTIINDNIQYLDKEDEDFGIAVSDETKLRVNDLIAEIHNRIRSDISGIDNDIKASYLQEESQSQSFTELYEKISFAQETLSQYHTNDPRKIAQNISSSGIMNENAGNLKKNIGFLDYFQSIHKSSELFEIENPLAKSKRFIADSQKWYGFLINLHDVLSYFDIQRDTKRFDVKKLMSSSVEKEGEINVDDIGLDTFLESIGSKTFFGVENIQLNSNKVNALKSILQQTMVDDVVSFCSSEKLIVNGYMVKMSEINEIECNAKLIEIFALHKVFIDDDFNKTGQDVAITIVSPIWEVIGDRKIILNGADGKAHQKPAERGGDGMPGNPGGSAGVFIAVGHRFINGDHLQIELNGGKGGGGQNGDEGKTGVKGKDPPSLPSISKVFENSKVFRTLLSEDSVCSLCVKFEVDGSSATRAEDGANGGVAGLGGNAGKSLIVSFGETPKLSVSQKRGTNGVVGKGGLGGVGASNGDIHFNSYSITSFDQLKTTVRHGKKNSNGLTGVDGCNRKGIQFPRNVNLRDINSSQIVTSYKIYADKHFINKKRVSDSDFLKTLLDDHRMQFSAHCDDTEEIEIFIPEQCQKKTNVTSELGNKTTKSGDLIRELIDEMHERMINDVDTIDDRIKAFYIQSGHSNGISSKMLSNGFEKLSQIRSCKPKMCESQLIDAINALNLNVSIDEFKGHNKFLDFLLAFNGAKTGDSFQIDYKLTKTVKYLRDSEKWYGFLAQLNDVLYEYASGDGGKQLVEDMIKRCTVKENETRKASEIGLTQVLDRMSRSIPDEIAKMTLDSQNLNALKKLLQQALFYKIHSICGESELIVVGYNVKMSEVKQISCGAKLIQIFAMHKVLIDDDIDKTGQSVQITIIAPIWEIVNQRKISLNGAKGQEHYYSQAQSGSDGLPGRPGQSAGHFVGIGKQFINEGNLKIELNGGQGSNGQNGGRGSDGVRGNNAPYIANYRNRDESPHQLLGKVQCYASIPFLPLCYLVRFFGTKATEAGRGGNGGAAGFGGYAGKFYIAGIDHPPPNFSIQRNPGMRGQLGIGGDGGNGASDGDDYENRYGKLTSVLHESRLINGAQHGRGIRGANGSNDGGIQQPDVVPFRDPSLVQYKKHFEEFIANGIPDTYSIKFLSDLYHNEKIRSL